MNIKMRSWSGMGAGITLLAGVAIAFAAGDRGNTPAAKGAEADKPIAVKAVQKSPAGPKFPVCWTYKFEESAPIVVGKDVEIKVTVAPSLFDMKEVELTPAVGGELQLIAGEGWKGALKKGEAHVVAFTIRATTNGFNGPYGVSVRAPGFYDELRAYILGVKEGLYSEPEDKEAICDQIDGMRNEQPVCEEWFGSTVDLPAKGGK